MFEYTSDEKGKKKKWIFSSNCLKSTRKTHTHTHTHTHPHPPPHTHIHTNTEYVLKPGNKL